MERLRFKFYDKDVSSEARANLLVAEVETGIKARGSLFEELSKQLKFPSYFGQNWDALEDCFRDFEWISRDGVAIIHREIPLRGDDQKVYLDILNSCCKFWSKDKKLRFEVFFPKALQEKIEAILSSDLA